VSTWATQGAPQISRELLMAQDSLTTTAIIDNLRENGVRAMHDIARRHARSGGHLSLYLSSRVISHAGMLI